jgi:outer membrane protein OmpA-like peptidoglycan-associated protein
MRAAAGRGRLGGLAVATCLALGVSGCTLGARPPAARDLMITEPVAGSSLVAVVPGPAAGPSLDQVIAATVRPGEDIDILRAGPAATVLAASDAPRPARVVAPGRPAAPSGGSTPFQQAAYRRSLARWRAEVRQAEREAAARTLAALTAWVRALDLTARVGRLPEPATGSGPGRAPGRLGAVCAAAASALAGLDEASGAGPRRVVLLYAESLAGSLPAGELTGADVVVVTSFLPTAAAVSAAQGRLLAAGAAQARVLGPETTGSQLAQLVDLGLSHRLVTDTLSGAALFGNDSARLTPGAGQMLTPLLSPLREPGAVAVISGFASTTGDKRTNMYISDKRAAAVAAWLEARGIPASSLDIVGHGATDLVAAGPSAANRRVVVIIEEPAAPVSAEPVAGAALGTPENHA